MDGLALNHLFDPDVLDNRELARYIKLCLRETLQGISQPKEKPKRKNRKYLVSARKCIEIDPDELKAQSRSAVTGTI
jgi:hypothetical protein